MTIYGSWGSIFDSGLSHPWSLLSSRTRWSIRSIFTLQENDETMTNRNNAKQEKPITRTFYWISILSLFDRIFKDRTVLKVDLHTVSHEKFSPDLDDWLFRSLGYYQIRNNSGWPVRLLCDSKISTVCEFTVTQIFRKFFHSHSLNNRWHLVRGLSRI